MLGFHRAQVALFHLWVLSLAERWRVDLTLVLGAALIVWLLWLNAPRRQLAAILFFLVYPILSFILLHGAPWLGLPRIDSDLWGGIFVSLLVAIVGIVVSLPLGISSSPLGAGRVCRR